jgi:hypothetical protein
MVGGLVSFPASLLSLNRHVLTMDTHLGTTVRQRVISLEQLIGNFRSNVIGYYHHVDT